MVSFLLSVTFACGVFIAVAHVVNQRFIAPVYDVAANLAAFGSGVAPELRIRETVGGILTRECRLRSGPGAGGEGLSCYSWRPMFDLYCSPCVPRTCQMGRGRFVVSAYPNG